MKHILGAVFVKCNVHVIYFILLCFLQDYFVQLNGLWKGERGTVLRLADYLVDFGYGIFPEKEKVNDWTGIQKYDFKAATRILSLFYLFYVESIYYARLIL